MHNSTAFLFVAILFFMASGCNAQPQSNSLKLVETIPLENISGRIDHMSYNSKTNLVAVAALGNNTVEVVNLTNKKIIHTIKNLHEPQGVIFITDKNFLFVANGNGEFDLFNATNFKKINSIQLTEDADNVRYDEAGGKIYLGYGNGGIAIIDANIFKLIREIKLSAHPESLQVDKSTNKIYVNVPGKKEIDVIDLIHNKIVAKWSLNEASANFPMALDEKNHRLFVGCRHPSKLLVLNSETGKTVASIEIDGDTDDIFYNQFSKEIYVSCGSGYEDVIHQIDANNYTQTAKIETNPGARTSLFIPKLHQLIVAAPQRMGTNAQLMIYKTN